MRHWQVSSRWNLETGFSASWMAAALRAATARLRSVAPKFRRNRAPQRTPPFQPQQAAESAADQQSVQLPRYLFHGHDGLPFGSPTRTGGSTRTALVLLPSLLKRRWLDLRLLAERLSPSARERLRKKWRNSCLAPIPGPVWHTRCESHTKMGVMHMTWQLIVDGGRHEGKAIPIRRLPFL